MAHAASARTKTRILDGALACFADKGYDATAIADIRAHSGLSTGSLYHFYRSKEGIAAALAAMLEEQWWGTLLDSPPAGAEDAVRALPGRALRWAVGDPARWRLLRSLPRGPEAVAVRTQALARAEDLFMTFLAAGALRRMPPSLAVSTVLGPVDAFLDAWVLEATPIAPHDAAKVLGESAWRAVAAR